jgi:hypothetical protein
MTEQESEQDRNCHYDLQSLNRTVPSCELAGGFGGKPNKCPPALQIWASYFAVSRTERARLSA